MAKKTIKKEVQLKKPVCPHCKIEIERIDWRHFDEGRITIVCCTACMTVIGVK